MEIIPCRQATYLISKREGHALTLRERFQLLVHLIVCEFCRRFLEQTKIISKEAKRLASEEKLTQEEKRKIREALNLL
jgi:hypothetical protein